LKNELCIFEECTELTPGGGWQSTCWIPSSGLHPVNQTNPHSPVARPPWIDPLKSLPLVPFSRSHTFQYARRLPGDRGRHQHDTCGARVRDGFAAGSGCRMWRIRACRRPSGLRPQVSSGMGYPGRCLALRYM